jgi:hypothetical protein
MTTDRRRLVATLACAIALAACASPSPTATPVVSAAGSPTSAASPSSALISPGAATPTAVPSVSPVAGSAAALAALLPSSVNGVAYTRSSFDGGTIPGSGASIDSTRMAPVLARYGRTLADVRFAEATPTDTSAPETAMVIALQVAGVPATEWIADTGADPSAMTAVTIAGKAVLRSGGEGYPVILYTKNDVLFEVLLAGDDTAAAIVGALP